MSDESTVFAHPTTITAPTTLACPGCGRADQLYAVVEIVEVLTLATFSLGQSTRAYVPDEASYITLADTQHWPAGGAIACRNCDRVDLRYDDLIPLIELADPAALSGAVTMAPPVPRAQS
jgi:hypothetical protein